MSLTLCLASMAPPGCMGRRKARTRRRSASWRREWRIISQLLTQTLGFDVSGRPGAGAAGGMGAALIAYTGATLRPGIDLVLELLNADDHLRDAALTIVGEGWLDRQSAFGKARWAWQAKPHAMACRLWPFAAGVMRAAGNYINTILTQCGLFASALWRWQSR